MNFIAEVFERRLATRPDHAFLYDELTPKGVTCERGYEISGRVYAYLKGLDIGKEDFVLIKLPRGVQPVLAMFGIWRAGAAWVLVEDTYAPDRIEFIRKVARLLASHLEQGAFTFGDIREAVLGRPSFVARLLGRDW